MFLKVLRQHFYASLLLKLYENCRFNKKYEKNGEHNTEERLENSFAHKRGYNKTVENLMMKKGVCWRNERSEKGSGKRR